MARRAIPAAFLLPLLAILLPAAPARAQDPTAVRREAMVREQIQERGVSDPRVLQAMRTVPRHHFVPQELARAAYEGTPLPIGEGETISQPYIVALMSELLETSAEQRVLEIGTGSGYQAAVLSELVSEVFSIEIKEPLHRQASESLARLGYANVRTRLADGYFGWPGEPPFDGIIVTAAVDHVPPPLLAQLKEGGRLVLPLGNPYSVQSLVVVTKAGGRYQVRHVLGVLFVPLTGKALGD